MQINASVGNHGCVHFLLRKWADGLMEALTCGRRQPSRMAKYYEGWHAGWLYCIRDIQKRGQVNEYELSDTLQ